MPGMGFGMGLGLSISLRQQLQLTLPTAIDTFYTSGEERAEREREILHKMLKDLDAGKYKDFADFRTRCMRRIKKEDRDEDVKSLVSEIRALNEILKPSLVDLRRLIELGAASSLSDLPSEIYKNFGRIYKSQPGSGLPHDGTLVAFFSDLRKNEGAVSDAVNLLASIATSPACSNAAELQRVIDRFTALSSKNVRDLNFIAIHFARLLDLACTQTFSLVETALEYAQSLKLLVGEQIEEQELDSGSNFLQSAERLKGSAECRNIPLPVFQALTELHVNNETMKRAASLFETKAVQKSTDAQRKLYRALLSIQGTPSADVVVGHILEIAASAEDVIKIFGYLELLQKSGRFVYFFDEHDSKKLIERLRKYFVSSAFSDLGLSESYLSKLLESHDRFQKGNLSAMISTYAGVLKGKFEEGLPLLREITEHIIDDDFRGWRYSHDYSAQQLNILGSEEGRKAWIKNNDSRRLIGNEGLLDSKVKALGIVLDGLIECFEETFKIKLPESISLTGQKLADCKKRLADCTDKQARQTLIAELNELSQEIRAQEVIVAIRGVSLDTIAALGALVRTTTAECKHQEFTVLLQGTLAILDSPEMRDLEQISVVETDAPEKLFNVGRAPIQSCQRWNEPTGHNQCLLAYIADSNKKLYQIYNSKNELLVRSIVRLLEIYDESTEEACPVLLIERPYATVWTIDYGKALVAQVAQKALEISRASGGKLVKIASSDAAILAVLDELCTKYETEQEAIEFSDCLPASKNAYEYSDSFGGRLARKKKVSGQITAVGIQAES